MPTSLLPVRQSDHDRTYFEITCGDDAMVRAGCQRTDAEPSIHIVYRRLDDERAAAEPYVTDALDCHGERTGGNSDSL
jgi:hypothetical protein